MRLELSMFCEATIGISKEHRQATRKEPGWGAKGCHKEPKGSPFKSHEPLGASEALGALANSRLQ